MRPGFSCTIRQIRPAQCASSEPAIYEVRATGVKLPAGRNRRSPHCANRATERQLMDLRQNGELLNGFKLICPVQSHFKKYSASPLTQITSISPAVLSHRGAARDRHGRGAGCGGRGCAADERRKSGRRSRVVLTPRCWRQVCEKKRRRRWQTSPVTGESTKEAVKTIAWGMPGDSGVT